VLKFALRFVLIEHNIFSRTCAHFSNLTMVNWITKNGKAIFSFLASIFTTNHQLSFSLLTAQLLKDKLKL